MYEASEVKSGTLMTSGGVPKELELELFNLGTNVAILIIPLINGSASVVGIGTLDANLIGIRRGGLLTGSEIGMRLRVVHFGSANGL